MKTTLYLVLVLVWLAVPLMVADSKNAPVEGVTRIRVGPARKTDPVLRSVSPTSAVAGGGNFTLTATGLYFSSSSIVQWNGASLKTIHVTATRLCASVPSANIALAGTANITVSNHGPRKFGGTSRPMIFTITTPLAVSTLSVPSAIVGSMYSANLTATGGIGAYTWGLYASGRALPPGLQLTSIGTLTGTPTTAGTYPFDVQVIDSANDEATQSYSMTVASSTAGCGAGTDNSQCGNVGDPYAGQGAPAANATITSCGELNPPSSGYVYRLAADIGSDPTAECLTWYYGYPFVLDLNGYTVTGMIAGAMNPYGVTIMNGTVNCNSTSTGCIDIEQDGAPAAYDKVHHLSLNQAALGGRCINFNQENAYASVSTPYLQIYNVQGTLPNSLEGDDRSYLIWVSGAGTVPAEVWNATVSPGANLNAFQGITMYQTVGSYVHNNYIVLPPPAYDTSAYDTDRAILFDCEGKVGSPCGSNVAAYNQIVADQNRAFRVRAETGDVIHDNLIQNCRLNAPAEACIHIGDTDTQGEATSAEIYGNTLEMNDGAGIELGGDSSGSANVHDNTVTCYLGDCSRAGWFAFTSLWEAAFPHPTAAGTLTVKNTTFPSAWGSQNAVLSCGPAGNPSYICGIPDDTASVAHCNTGTVVGNGIMTQSCP